MATGIDPNPDPLLSRSGCFLVSYCDDNDAWASLERHLYGHLPIRNITWKHPSGTALLKIPMVTFTFVSEHDPELNFAPMPYNWYRKPHAHVFLLRCATMEEYKATVKAQLTAWVEGMMKKQLEWLVIMYPEPSSDGAVNKKWAKVRARF